MSYKISIPDVPPSLNQQGRAWGKTMRLKKEWQLSIFVRFGSSAVRNLRELAEQRTKMRVAITIHNAREYDDDNKRFPEKIIYDALKNLGLLHDDRPEFVERELGWVKCPRKDKHTEIEIGVADAPRS